MSLGERFASAVGCKDSEALCAMLADGVDFKALTPGRFWEASSPHEVLDVLFDNWFGPNDRIDTIVTIEDGADVGDVRRVGYRFGLTTPDGRHAVEQQVYYREHDGQLSYLRVVCSGFRPSRTETTE